jgi:hypothetical protein
MLEGIATHGADDDRDPIEELFQLCLAVCREIADTDFDSVFLQLLYIVSLCGALPGHDRYSLKYWNSAN